MPESDELQAKLKNSDPEVQDYVVALKKEIAALQKKNVSLEAKNVSLDHRVDSLTEELESHRKPALLTEEEEEDIMIPLAIQFIKKAGGIDEFIMKHNISRDHLTSKSTTPNKDNQ